MDDKLFAAGRQQKLSGWRAQRTQAGALEDCSLIIATYERPQQVAHLVEALAASIDCPAEVVVVDGSRSRESETALRMNLARRDLPFDLIYVQASPGLTRQRNIGIDVSSRPYVYFLDDDCLPQANYFSAIRAVFEDDKNQRIGAVCGLVVNEMNNPLTWRWRMRRALRIVPQGEPGSYFASGSCAPRNPVRPFSGIRRVDNLHGCAMAFRRVVLDRNRFSEFFEGYSQGEDLEMSLRVGRAWQIVWCGDAHVGHYHASSGRPTSFAKGRMEVRNRYFIWKRYCPNAKLSDRFRFWLDAAFLVVMDLGQAVLHPTQVYPLAHAAGVVYGALNCLLRPPRYQEPPARKQYTLSHSVPVTQ